MRARRPALLDWRRIMLALVIAAAGLWIGAQSLTARSASADALGARAREALGSGDAATASDLAHRALRRDPTVVAAVQTLGLVAEERNEEARASRLLAYADRLSRRDLQTHLWAIERDVARRDVDAALRDYDLALRTSGAARDLLFPVLSRAVADRAVAQALARRWRAAPAWRADFIGYLARDPQVAPALAVGFLASNARSARPSPDDLAALISRASEAGDVDSAWRAYRLARPRADRRQVRDPDFSDTPGSATVYDWLPSSADGIVARMSPQARGGLEIDAEPGAAGIAVEQRQRLPAGRYRLAIDAGPMRAEGFVWSLQCAGGAPLARVPIVAGPARRTVSSVFAISSDCPLQRLALGVDAGDSTDTLHGEMRRVVVIAADAR